MYLSRSPRSSWRCCPPSLTRRSWLRRCRRSPATSARLADVSWVVTAYVVAAAATTPLWGKLGDRYGRKRLLEISLGSVPRRVGRLRRGPVHHVADRRPRRAGRGRGRADDARDGRRRRPRLAAGARPLPGLHRRDLRGRHRRSAHSRRPAGRAGELALGLLRQPAARRCSRWPGCAAAARRPRASDRDKRLDVAGALLLAGATAPDAGLHLGRRAATPGSRPQILGARSWRGRARRRRWSCASAAPPTRSCRSTSCARRRWRSPARRSSSRRRPVLGTVFVPLYLQPPRARPRPRPDCCWCR